MHSATNPQGMQTVDQPAASEAPRHQQIYESWIWRILWICGLCLLVVSCFVIHAHPRPYAIDLLIMQDVQRPVLPAWVTAIINFPGWFDGPLMSYIFLGLWSAFFLIMVGVTWLRKHSPLTWLLSGIFFAGGDMGGAGLNVLLDEIVNRPRPTSADHVHVPPTLVPFPTYPSGHTEHVVVYYGFLLYLSFLPRVRTWRYRKLLLPLQIYAVFDILIIGYSRVFAGDHWPTDVLGGYLEGLICLGVLIFLYQLARKLVTRWQAQRTERAAHLQSPQ